MSKDWLSNTNKMNYEDFDEPRVKEVDHYDEKLREVVEEYDNGYDEPYEGCWTRFINGMRGCWATKETENTEGNKELYIQTTLRELVVYMVFLAVLMIITFGSTIGLMYYFTNVLNTLFITTPFNGGGGPYSNAACMADFWSFLTGPLLSGLYWNQWYNNIPISNSELNFILYENKLIGLPRLRQVRVKNNSCTIPNSFINGITKCYAPYSPASESKDSFGLANSSAWIYTSQDDLQSRPSTGTIGTYGGGGFYVDLNQTQSDSLNTITFLYNNLWTDRGTRAVILDFTVYNANLNLFSVIKITTEFPATGGVIPNFEFRTVKLIRYVSPSDYLVMACELIFLIFLLYYIVEEAIEIRKHGLLYFNSFWNCLDIVVIVVGLLCTILNIFRTISVQNYLQNLLVNGNKYPNFDYLSFWQLLFNYSIALTLFFAWVKFFKYISFNKTMTQLSSTLGRCAKDLAGFAVMFFIIFLAFAQLGYLLFGSQVNDYRGFDITIYTLFRIILGDFDFNSLEKVYTILGPIYFLSYVFFVFFVLFNMFLAIINDTYSEVKADLANQANEFEIGDYFKERANMMLSKLHLKKEKLIDLQGAIFSADANNDNLLDFDEWKAELKTRGFEDEEIEAVFSKYDTDGNRVLDEAERINMQKELEDQKAALNNEIKKTENDELANSMNCGKISSMAVSMEDFEMLVMKVDRMEKTLNGITAKVDGVLRNIGTMDKTKSKRKDTMGLILNTLTSDENLDEEEKKKKIETLVKDEMTKINEESMVSLRTKSSRKPDF